MADFDSKTRVIARLLRELLREQRFAEFADLKDALWRRLLKLKIRVTSAEFDQALTVVASNAKLVVQAAQSSRPVEQPTPTPTSRGEAAAILRSLGIRVRGGRLRQADERPTDAPEHFPDLVEIS